MFFKSFSLGLGLLLAPLALAATHDVTVGSSSGTLEFSPEAIFATPGDQVVFHFQQKNHSVVQSSLASPCAQKEGGFNSGFFPVSADVTDNFPTYTLTVNDTSAVWVYCSQAANTAASHCGKGMVFAINCGADGAANSFTNFKNAALQVGAGLAAQASGSASGSSTSAAYGSSSTSTGSGYGSGSGSGSGTGTGTSSGAATTHTVLVGVNSSLTFQPSEVTAQAGDVVEFQFMSKNHTVTQSTFGSPCLKASISNSSMTSFDSGFMPVAADASSFPTYQVTVNDTAPVWAYCRQSGHCGMGMVMAINAVDSGPKNFTAYRASAMQQNGTSTSTSSGAGSSSTAGGAAGSSGAPRTVGVASSLLAAVAAVFVLVL